MAPPHHPLPSEIQNTSTWYGPDLAERQDWIKTLSDVEIGEIETATKRLADAEIEIPSIRREDFPLPMLHERLQQILDDVLNGRGFVLLRGLPVER
ncbi:MAG TPA: TauD/TfdA family dioxygenase, partial [Blastocatellia bacterium]|nr:TauD/TfdA family dioxygenase [Blastocatellia bacterium]